jgi:hypothetical protein
MNKINKKITCQLVVLLLVMIIPLFSADAAGLIPCGTDANPEPCTLCHFIVGIQGIVSFGLRILISVAVLGIFISGIMYIISSGNEQTITVAKNSFGASIKGFTIVLAAWFLVNITFWVLSANETLGIATSKENWYTFTCSTRSTAAPATPTTQQPLIGDESEYDYDRNNILYQRLYIGPELSELLDCMRPKLVKEAKIISSISDSAGMSNCVNSYSRPPCAHTEFSCHYGGRNCRGRSLAADFGNESYATQIQQAANECGGKSLVKGNHVHVSIAGSCGCDDGL